MQTNPIANMYIYWKYKITNQPQHFNRQILIYFLKLSKLELCTYINIHRLLTTLLPGISLELIQQMEKVCVGRRKLKLTYVLVFAHVIITTRNFAGHLPTTEKLFRLTDDIILKLV